VRSGPAQAEAMKIEIRQKKGQKLHKIAPAQTNMNTSLNPFRKQESYKA